MVYCGIWSYVHVYRQHGPTAATLRLFMLSKTIITSSAFKVSVPPQSELLITSPMSSSFVVLHSFGCLVRIHNTSTRSSSSSTFPSLSHDLPSWSMSYIIVQATSDSRWVHLTLHLQRWCSECQEWCQLLHTSHPTFHSQHANHIEILSTVPYFSPSVSMPSFRQTVSRFDPLQNSAYNTSQLGIWNTGGFIDLLG